MSKKIITRFAPSPTGLFHSGSYRTALYSYIFARQNNGEFVLRIEDTDKIRSKKEYEDNIIESLKWLGLDYDHFYRQSERTSIYKKYIQQLIDSGHAFVSKEDGIASDDKEKRQSVIRFKNPNRKVSFEDIIRGKVEFDTTELGDFVIAKTLEEPVFHLAVVIDDMDMGITHVIRGEDHISNTPRQILIYEALGQEIPIYAHIPLLLASDRSKLSKRHGAKSISEYKDRGFLPEAIVNYLSLLGWHPEDDREVLSLSEIKEKFTLERVQKGGAIFDEEKLRWFNKQYIAKIPENSFIDYVNKFSPTWLLSDRELLNRVLPLIKEKITTFEDIGALLSDRSELSFIQSLPEYSADSLLWKKNPSIDNAKTHLTHVLKTIETIDEISFTADHIKSLLWAYVEEKGKGDVLWPMRYAITGLDKSPDPFISAFILGKSETMKRIRHAISKLENK
jgi:glutamyl-tRNA synthetase